MTINDKIKSIRDMMVVNNIDVYIITKFDPHQSEDSEPYYNSVQFISGFTGSNGAVVITKDEAGLWTDGRYYIQSEIELKGSEIKLHKASEPDVKSYLEYAYHIGGTIGFAGDTLSYGSLKKILGKLKLKNIKLKTKYDFVGDIWKDRPSLSTNKVFEHNIKFCGKSRVDKIKEIREKMIEEDGAYYILSSLDDISWTLNLKGRDVAYNTFFASYLIISNNEVVLFVDKAKIVDVEASLCNDNIIIKDYSEVYNYIENIPDNTKTLINTVKTNYKIYSSGSHLQYIELSVDITAHLKAIKNKTEISCLEEVNLRDGVAMVKAIKYIKENVQSLDEIDVVNTMQKYRGESDNFIEPSFGTIAAYMENAAMMHYHATDEKKSKLESKGFLLIDSGGQYLDGTTDITRTISLGPITKEMKEDFTLVLKSHIAIAKAKFLNGTTGSKIDMLGRVPMWNVGKNYKCGTGHGLGFCGCVHEGPHSMGMKPNPVPLKEGMLLTNEPGIYIQDKYGIRIENTVVVTPFMETNDGVFFQFDTISYCPIDVDSIEVTMLTEEEKDWINNYHRLVYTKLSPFLDDIYIEFLKEETKEI